ncbi:Peptidase propeptide and YPEB domain protein [Tepidimonas alkaliphilus]|uniref:Peptidase propeptide and YPEB domain protein n=1 Tax=Tepidimonas alkaliphilus TaxID=2588942 RepID=A0A554WBK8_9BURK|nr:PepSY domain-containing protein [Tepidimonas alkaliphilus]TSE20959.1 Peptidase propeptide and YPEB domain protein [Tepidimonas alkaliphilus]
MALALTIAWPLAQADRALDHRRAREAVLAGEIRPLAEILQRVQPLLDGEIIATELEREHGRWVYEFKVLRSDGRVVEWSVDAREGNVLKTEVKRGKR